MFLLFTLLTGGATWPQCARLDSIPDNIDAYFNIWRLAWVAHQLPSDPAHLFDANIYHPHPTTFAYSDAVLLQGVVGLPFIRAGLRSVHVYNVLVLASFVLCAMAMALLARRVTGGTLPAVCAGLVFAFAPYRFDHYYHLELLWAMWIPLAFWATHRTVESGRLGDGLLVGVFVALQFASSIYYGIFLSTVLGAFSLVLIAGQRGAAVRRSLLALTAGGLLAVLVVSPYAGPYRAARADVGERERGTAVLYGAGPRHYLATTPEHVLEGPLLSPLGRHEKRLFPGVVASVLAALALWPPVTRVTVAYALVLALAVNFSAGYAGIGYWWLYDHVEAYRGLRVPSRFAQITLAVVALLSAIGLSRMYDWLAPRTRHAKALVVALLVVAGAEYVVWPLTLVRVETAPPPAYEWLRTQPRGVLLELPLQTRGPVIQGLYQYRSTFHWWPTVNGYSGNMPEAYSLLEKSLAGAPDAEWVAALIATGATHLFVHQRYHEPERYGEVIRALADRTDVTPVKTFDDEGHAIAVYRFSRSE